MFFDVAWSDFFRTVACLNQQFNFEKQLYIMRQSYLKVRLDTSQDLKTSQG